MSAYAAERSLRVFERPAVVDGNGPAEFAPLAVNPTHLVLASPTHLVIFRKANATQGDTVEIARRNVREFWGHAPGSLDRFTDPDISYDADSGRFFVVYGDTTPGNNQILLAVSKSSLPETLDDTDWYRYRLPRNDTADEGDFDHLAFAGNRLLISWQRTRRPATGPLGDGTMIRVLDKRPFLVGELPQIAAVDFVIPSERNLRARPASLSLARDREVDRVFFDVSSQCGAGQRWSWRIAALTNIAATPVLSERDVASQFPCFNAPTQVPQPDGAPSLSVARLAADPVYRDGRLWVFEWNGPRDGASSGAYWAEFDVRGWPDDVRLVQSGVHEKPGLWIIASAGALDVEGNLVLTFTGVGRNRYPAMSVTGRLATDPDGTLHADVTVNEAARAWQMASSRLSVVMGAVADETDGGVWIAGTLPAPTRLLGSVDSAAITVAKVTFTTAEAIAETLPARR